MTTECHDFAGGPETMRFPQPRQSQFNITEKPGGAVGLTIYAVIIRVFSSDSSARI
jgi:hypothetical protein